MAFASSKTRRRARETTRIGALSWGRRALRLLAMVAMLIEVTPTHAAVKIRVRGVARIEAHPAREAGELVLRGTITDDANAPIPSKALALTMTKEGSNEPVALFDAALNLKKCGASGRDPRPAGSGAALVDTDETGHFCVRASLPIDRYVAHLAWGGSALIDGGTSDVPIDMSRQALTLRFSPEPRAIDLDAASFVVDAAASIEEGGMTHPGPGLAIAMSTERGDLSSATTNASGHATFAIDPPRLGPAGQGELRLAFRGNLDTAAATYALPVERRAHVTLHAKRSNEDLVRDPEDGVPFDVIAESAHGVVTGGSVEAYVGDTMVGAAPIAEGRAHLVVTFAESSEIDVPITLRYVAAVPWFAPGRETVVGLPIAGPSPWRRAPLAIAVLAVIGWLILARRRPKLTLPKLARKDEPSTGIAKIDMIAESADFRGGWKGRIHDAHDGSPIAGARVAIERGGFDAAVIVATSDSNAEGRFEISAEAMRTIREGRGTNWSSTLLFMRKSASHSPPPASSPSRWCCVVDAYSIAWSRGHVRAAALTTCVRSRPPGMSDVTRPTTARPHAGPKRWSGWRSVRTMSTPAPRRRSTGSIPHKTSSLTLLTSLQASRTCGQAQRVIAGTAKNANRVVDVARFESL